MNSRGSQKNLATRRHGWRVYAPRLKARCENQLQEGGIHFGRSRSPIYNFIQLVLQSSLAGGSPQLQPVSQPPRSLPLEISDGSMARAKLRAIQRIFFFSMSILRDLRLPHRRVASEGKATIPWEISCHECFSALSQRILKCQVVVADVHCPIRLLGTFL